MQKNVLFIQGGGEDGHTADKPVMMSLANALGKAYTVQYPRLTSDSSKPDYGWLHQIADTLAGLEDNMILVAHSFGASMLLKLLSEHRVDKRIAGIFMFGTPWWKGDEYWQKGFVLRPNFADHLPENIPIFLYHAQDDDEVPFEHLHIYRTRLRDAVIRELKTGGHQLAGQLDVVAADILALPQ